MNRKRLTALFLSLAMLGLAGCGKPQGAETIPTTTTTAPSLGYEQITAAQAKRLMDTETGYVILDTRTKEEFEQGHIEGAILIPEYEIGVRAKTELPDKAQLILVYCRSGRRSKIASSMLAALGYTNVKEFGGIIDWPYETVQ